MRFGTLGWVAWLLLIVGGINWGLVGIFRFDLVAAVFGGAAAPLSRIIYAAVGVAAIWQLFMPPVRSRAEA
ncbi:MAG: DUF378 domain-containing protein [Solirubrobacteraceae bacterium]